MNFKKLALCMALVMLLVFLAGCHGDVGTSSETPSIDFESQAHIQVNTSEDDTSMPTEESQPPLTGDVVVNEKKYDYKGNNIELLHVENQTNRHLNITIKGKYLDKDGNVIKEETQEFGAFPSGWSNYFIFYPECAFDSFTYVLETEEYTKEVLYRSGNTQFSLLATDSDGNPLASYINFVYDEDLTWGRHVILSSSYTTEARGLYLRLYMSSVHPTVTIGAEYHVLILDADGNVYSTGYVNDWTTQYHGSVGQTANDTDGRDSILLMHQPLGGEETVPDNVQGVFTPIFAIKQVYDFKDYAGKLMQAIN